MTPVHFIGGEKGGVGKSLVARILAQYFIDRQMPFIGFDSDRSHSSFMRFYAGYVTPVTIDRYEGLDHIIEAAVEIPARRVIVDLAAQSYRTLAQWIDDTGLLEASKELGVDVRYWHVMDAGRDSADLLNRLLGDFGDRLPLVLVLNQVRGSDFSTLEGSGALDRAEELGAHIVTLTSLQDSTMQKIDAHDTSFWAASTRESKTGVIGPLERQRVKRWLHRAYEEIDTVSP
jgi:hypothetical protein